MVYSPSARRRLTSMLAAIAVVAAVPAAGAAAEPSHPNPANEMVRVLAPGGDVIALINSGQTFDGETFEGIPDGIGLVPVQGRRADRGDRGGPRGSRYLDIYVNFEQSHVPFQGLADFEDSSVQRARLDLETGRIVELDEVLPASAGFIRFCSAFMAGPDHGFPNYTMLLNEESNDQLSVPSGAPYGADPSIAPNRQGGLAAYLDTRTGKYDALEGHGRHNHENNVIVPGGWDEIVALSGDDTFTTTSSPARPNLSQMYLHTTRTWRTFLNGEGTLYGFRVTGTDGGPVDADDAQNGANDVFDIEVGDTWTGEFIPVPEDIANGTTAQLPQDALEDWSNANNIFQFIRIEDVAYDPDDPRTVYFTDTGNTRLWQDPSTGRLWRLGSSDLRLAQSRNSNGRLYRMVFDESNPLQVDEFSIFADGGAPALALPGGGTLPAIAPPSGHPAWRAPDNMDVSRDSIMVQEDASDAKIWRYSLTAGTWTQVAQVDQDQNPATTGDPGESSGIVDASKWLGDGWWVLDVQSHTNQTVTTGAPFVWNGPPGPAPGTTYQMRRENGQLLLMYVPGS
jgi:Bacterial protein of unknown function (DUF839)